MSEQPIRGWWTLTVARNGMAIFDSKAREDLGERRVEVVPVPDEQDIERAARHMAEKRWATWLHGPKWEDATEGNREAWRADARAVLAAALEQPRGQDGGEGMSETHEGWTASQWASNAEYWHGMADDHQQRAARAGRDVNALTEQLRATVEAFAQERQAVLDCVNLYGDCRGEDKDGGDGMSTEDRFPHRLSQAEEERVEEVLASATRACDREAEQLADLRTLAEWLVSLDADEGRRRRVDLQYIIDRAREALGPL